MTLFWVKVNTPACQKCILTSSCLPFLHFLLFTRAVCHGTVSSPSLGKKNAGSHPKVWARPSFRGAGAASSPPAALAVHWRAWACRLSPCHSPLNGAAFLQMSSVAAATTLQLKSKSQLSHLNALKYYFFFLPFDGTLIFYPLICFLIKLFRFKWWLGFCVFHPWYQCICPGRISELVWVLWMPHKTSPNKSRSCGVKL